MEIKFTLALPRDALSVPVVRRVLRGALDVLGVERTVVADIELALTEACTNVLDHAGEGQEYEISAGVDGDSCVIEVVDRGSGPFDGSAHGHRQADPSAEEGRGIQLMRSLVDKVEFTSRPRRGTVVHLEKALVWTEGSAIKALTEGQPATEHGPWAGSARSRGTSDPR